MRSNIIPPVLTLLLLILQECLNLEIVHMVSSRFFAFAQILSICLIGFIKLMDGYRPILWNFKSLLYQSINFCVVYNSFRNLISIYCIVSQVYYWSRPFCSNRPEYSSWYNYSSGIRVYHFYLDKFSFNTMWYTFNAINLFNLLLHVMAELYQEFSHRFWHGFLSRICVRPNESILGSFLPLKCVTFTFHLIHEKFS